MKLSEAMMLGSVTCKMEPHNWNSCGLGCAGNAIGIPQTIHENYLMADGMPRWIHLERAWPWIMDHELCYSIWSQFDYKVCEGRMTFEQLVDYVRSIEPDCGECNRFDCTCKPAEAPAVPVEVQA